MKFFVIIIVVLGLTTGCENRPVDIPRSDVELIDEATENEIRGLINQLASANYRLVREYHEFTNGSRDFKIDDWGRAYKMVPIRHVEGAIGVSNAADRPDDWNEEAQEVVKEAKQKLARYGKTAFPFLLETYVARDNRYSETRPGLNDFLDFAVGRVCYQIITDQVDPIGQTRWPLEVLAYFDKHLIVKWWKQNRNESLRKMKLDVLKWRMEQGGPREYLDKVNEHLRELQL